jgi:hypothetical protein
MMKTRKLCTTNPREEREVEGKTDEDLSTAASKAIEEHLRKPPVVLSIDII